MATKKATKKKVMPRVDVLGEVEVNDDAVNEAEANVKRLEAYVAALCAAKNSVDVDRYIIALNLTGYLGQGEGGNILKERVTVLHKAACTELAVALVDLCVAKHRSALPTT